MRNIKQTLINTVLPIISAMAVAGLAYAAWVEPGTTPPGDNVAAPVNIGATTQYKSGALGIGGVFATDIDTFLALLGGRVGIGTANPGAKLEVAGQIKITGGTPGADKVLTSDASGLAAWKTPATGVGGSGTANYLSKWTTGTTLGNSIIYDNGTNVGIGTANPAQKLHVVGGKAQADDFCLNSDPTNKCLSTGLLIQDLYSDCLCNSGTPSCKSGYKQVGSWTGSCCPGDWCGPVLQCVLCVKYL